MSRMWTRSPMLLGLALLAGCGEASQSGVAREEVAAAEMAEPMEA